MADSLSSLPQSDIEDVRKLHPSVGRSGLSVIGPYHKLRSRYRDNSDWYIQESTGVVFRIGRVNGAKIDLPRESYVKQIKIWNGLLSDENPQT